jgi:VWFA-related protein
MPWSCRIERASVLAGLAGAALAISAVAGPSAQTPAQIAVREGLARNVYIATTDEKGAPAADLTPQEVTVKEDGASRNVLDVRPATEPMQVVLLIDDSGPGIRDIREGVASFIRIVQGSAEIAIVTTAKQNTVLVDFTSDRGALQNAVNRLTSRTTSGGYLLDAIQESARTLGRREAIRPVILVLALEGTEYSSVSAKQVLADVRRSGAIVHVVSVGKPGMKTMTSWNQRPTDSIHEALDETIARSAVFAEATRQSGGRLEQVGQASGIPARLSEIAYELRDQLVVTYARPQSAKPAEKIEITLKRRGVKVRAPKW